MIDFNNKPILKFKSEPIDEGNDMVSELLIENEHTVACFASMREKLIFTNKRLITLIRMGIGGNKIDYTSLPYQNILAFSIETHSGFDNHSELEIVIKDLGIIKFELKGDADIQELSRLIAKHIL